MKFESFPHGASTEQPKVSVEAKANQLREHVPAQKLEVTVSDLEKYLKLKMLHEVSYQDLPEELRQEIGSRNPIDEFIDRVGGEDADFWEMMQENYGPDWTHEDIEKLISKLRA